MKKSQLFQLILVQLKEFYREPGVLFWAIGFPILMAWGLGIAFNASPEIVRKVAVIENRPAQDEGPGILSEFLERQTKKVPPEKDGMPRYVKVTEDKTLGATTYAFISTDWTNAILLLKRGTVSLILKEENGRVTYHFDPANPEARLVQLQVEAMISGRNRLEESQDVMPMTLSGTRYIDFLIPGLITMGIMMSCMWGISWSIIDNRSKKLLRRMVATPMRKSNYLISLFIARLILTLIEAVLIYLFAYWYFDLKIQGSIPALILVCLAGNVAFTGVAILSASRISKPEIGNGVINAVTTPMLVLSGVFFSYHNFPDWSIPVIQRLPLTMLADSVRSIFNEGAGLPETLFPSAILTLLGIFTFAAGLRIYKWY
jgi:ABC-2 type transport system permease protein